MTSALEIRPTDHGATQALGLATASIGAVFRSRPFPHPRAWAVLASTTSSNDVLLRLAPRDMAGLLVVALRQTAGRGRSGSDWVSAPGQGIYFSLGAYFEQGAQNLGPVSLVAGLAVAAALRAQTGLDLKLKWPNDLEHAGAKLGGLLVESRPDAAGTGVVIGVGINLERPELSEARPVTGLNAISANLPSANELLAHLALALSEALSRYQAPDFSPWMEAWDRLDALKDTEVSWQAAGVTHVGRALGIARDGSLQVLTTSGLRQLYSGEVRRVRVTPPRLNEAAHAGRCGA